MVSILSKGFNGDSLNFSYKNKNNDMLLDDLAIMLKKVSAST
jgi:hypothetical protein